MLDTVNTYMIIQTLAAESGASGVGKNDHKGEKHLCNFCHRRSCSEIGHFPLGMFCTVMVRKINQVGEIYILETVKVVHVMNGMHLLHMSF
jgi:hypothetical protein